MSPRANTGKGVIHATGFLRVVVNNHVRDVAVLATKLVDLFKYVHVVLLLMSSHSRKTSTQRAQDKHDYTASRLRKTQVMRTMNAPMKR